MNIKIVFLYDRHQECFNRRVNDIVRFLEDVSNIKKLEIYYERKKEKHYDLYVILSNSIIEVIKYKKGIKIENNLVILTSNKDIDHVIKCINITTNMHYLNISNEKLLQVFLNLLKKQNIINHTSSSIK